MSRRDADVSAHQLIVSSPRQLQRGEPFAVPALFTDAGEDAVRRVFEFFTANIRNPNTRRNYAQAVERFAAWCERQQLPLGDLTPVHVAAYIEQLGQRLAKPTVKLHLAGIRMLLDYLVTGGVLRYNPASSVRGPKYTVKKGKTPVLTPEEARLLLDSIDTTKVAGLRDRALIGAMVYSFARIGAVLGMNTDDLYLQGTRWWIRLHEKGGKHHEVPAHHRALDYLAAYIDAADLAAQKGMPLFRRLDRKRRLSENRLTPRDALAMIKRRARGAGIGDAISCHTFRATGITTYLLHGGTIERAAAIAAHESTRTTQLYNRTSDAISLDEIERIIL